MNGRKIVTTGEWLADSPDRARTKDVAFIQVGRDFTGNLQLFSYKDTPPSGRQVHLGVVGYPGDKYLKDDEHDTNEAGAQMYEDFQYTDYDIADSKRNMIEYKVSTFGGQSGAPIIRRGNSIVAIGTHCYGGGGTEANSGNSIGGKYGNAYSNYIGLFSRDVKTENGRATIVPITESGSINGQSPFNITSINGGGFSSGGFKDSPSFQQLPGSKSVASSGDTEGILDILKTIGRGASVALPIAGSILGGPIGGGIATVAGSLLGYVSKAESALDNGTASAEGFAVERIAPGAAERAVLAQAALQTVVSLEHNAVSEGLIRDIHDNFNRTLPRLDNLVTCFKPVLTQHAVNIAVQGMNRTAGLSQNAAESGAYRNRVDLRVDHPHESAFEGEGGALLECLLTPTLPIAGEESWISDLGGLISSGLRTVAPIAGNLAKEYAPGIINGLVGKITGGSESTEIQSGLLSDEATRFVFKRALLADASLAAMQRLDKKQLSQLRLREDIAHEHAENVPEGAWGDFFKGAVQTIAPIALDAGKKAVASVAPKIINGVLNKVGLGGRSEALNAPYTVNGGGNGPNNTLRTRRSVLDMFNTANVGTATMVSNFEAPAPPLESSSLQATLKARHAEWQPLAERRRSLDDNDDLPVEYPASPPAI
ncbi:hypothetical protein F5X68DRAFT_233566 [Plectosphaerella plurivora]|uniref:Serine protease n=1 Tax=Plectosphaerella plurivora TaxID=936078 RepID=A0A9P9A9V5_9PEZI|nr:hypothetical protein F5X68DRAFT_233566 [Plectosphaerella plurivora]